MAAEFYGLATQAVLPMLRAMFDDNEPMSKPLMRVRQGALIAGVCGGIAKWLGWDPTIVRVVYVMLTLLSAAFPGVILYILLWILMPLEPE
jgi:phage shock protein PspC (stress-responsive transcriptional regulator)